MKQMGRGVTYWMGKGAYTETIKKFFMWQSTNMKFNNLIKLFLH